MTTFYQEYRQSKYFFLFYNIKNIILYLSPEQFCLVLIYHVLYCHANTYYFANQTHPISIFAVFIIIDIVFLYLGLFNFGFGICIPLLICINFVSWQLIIEMYLDHYTFWYLSLLCAIKCLLL